jgi:hypothetical protein
MENNAVALFKAEIKTIEGIIGINAMPGTNISAIALQELDFLQMHMVVKPFIAGCIPDTVIQAVKYSLKNNLSLDPNAGLVYLMPSSVKIGTEWKNVLEIKPTADGKLSIAYQCGTILDHERPKITKDSNGKVVTASVSILLPSPVAPRWETVEIDQSDFERMRKYSHIKNARGKSDADMKTLNYANKLYTNFNGGIDPEFARSKVVSVSLKKRGTNLAAKLTQRIVTQSSDAPFQVINEPEQKIEFATFEEVPNNQESFTAEVIDPNSL